MTAPAFQPLDVILRTVWRSVGSIRFAGRGEGASPGALRVPCHGTVMTPVRARRQSRALPPYRSSRHFFTHLPALSSHFISLAFVQSALVLGASFVCASTGVARATAKAMATADRTIFMSLLLHGPRRAWRT